MKHYILVAVALFITSIAYSQSEDEVDFIQELFGMEKKQVVADFVQPSEAENETFWKIYDEYESKRRELGKQRLELLKLYADEYLTMTSEQADEWTTGVIDLQKKTDALIDTYYGLIKKDTDALLATQFFQIENYILTYIRMHVLQDVPFVKK